MGVAVVIKVHCKDDIAPLRIFKSEVETENFLSVSVLSISVNNTSGHTGDIYMVYMKQSFIAIFNITLLILLILINFLWQIFTNIMLIIGILQSVRQAKDNLVVGSPRI